MTTPVPHISPKEGVQQLRNSGIYAFKGRGQRPDYFKFNFFILFYSPPTYKPSQRFFLFPDTKDMRYFRFFVRTIYKEPISFSTTCELKPQLFLEKCIFLLSIFSSRRHYKELSYIDNDTTGPFHMNKP
jgi:hypothetical protein